VRDAVGVATARVRVPVVVGVATARVRVGVVVRVRDAVLVLLLTCERLPDFVVFI